MAHLLQLHLVVPVLCTAALIVAALATLIVPLEPRARFVTRAARRSSSR